MISCTDAKADNILPQLNLNWWLTKLLINTLYATIMCHFLWFYPCLTTDECFKSRKSALQKWNAAGCDGDMLWDQSNIINQQKYVQICSFLSSSLKTFNHNFEFHFFGLASFLLEISKYAFFRKRKWILYKNFASFHSNVAFSSIPHNYIELVLYQRYTVSACNCGKASVSFLCQSTGHVFSPDYRCTNNGFWIRPNVICYSITTFTMGFAAPPSNQQLLLHFHQTFNLSENKLLFVLEKQKKVTEKTQKKTIYQNWAIFYFEVNKIRTFLFWLICICLHL